MNSNSSSYGPRLSRKIFLSLLGIAFLSVFIISFFWIRAEWTNYKSEVVRLRSDYTETKKLEIKTRILQVKDYIEWIHFFPEKPVTRILTNQLEQLNVQVLTDYASSENSISLSKFLSDSIPEGPVPIYILAPGGKLFTTRNADSKGTTAEYRSLAYSFLEYLKDSKPNEQGVLIKYRINAAGDSSISSLWYINNLFAPGYQVGTFVNSESFENILQIHVLDSISKIRFSENEYIFLNTYDGFALGTDGQYNKTPVDILNSGDTTWIKVFRIQQSSAEHPEGVFYSYTWKLLSDPQMSSKISYFSYLPSWQWIIGTGFYEEDVKVILDARRDELRRAVNKAVLKIVLYLLLSATFAYLISLLFARQLGINLELFQEFFRKMAETNELIDPGKFTYKEFDFLAREANRMVEARIRISTDLNRSIAQLTESENLYRTLINHLPQSIFLKDTSSVYQSCNKIYAKIIDLKPQEIVGKTDYDFFPPERAETYIIEDREVIENGQIKHIEEKYHEKGEIKWAHTIKVPYRDADNTIVGVFGVFEDITKRKEAEMALMESQAYNRMLFNQSSIGLAVTTPEAKFIDVNPAFAQIIGHTVESCLELNHWDITPEKYREQEYLQVEALDKTGHYGPYEKEYYHKDGHLVPVRLWGRYIFQQEQKLIWSSIENITEQKIVEAVIKESDEKFRALLDHSIQGILLIQDNKMSFVNPAQLKITGLTKKETLSMSLEQQFNLIHPEDREKAVDRYKRFEQGEEPSEVIEIRIIRKSGEIRWVYTASKTLTLRDKPARLVMMIDITDRKKAEDEIRRLNIELENRVKERTAELVNTNKELETFTYSVSHDLKAPLRGIDGYSKLLLELYHKDLNEEAQSFLETIRRSTLQMNQLIEDLLDYSRLERSKKVMVTINIRTFVKAALDPFRDELDSRKISLDVQVPDQNVVADTMGLTIALRNLVENAIKFTRSVSDPHIRIELTESESGWIISVRDNGIGIEKKYQKRVFEIFQRLHRIEDYPGTGIGLAMVQKAMQRMNGTARVQSSLGKGSTFFLELPKIF